MNSEIIEVVNKMMNEKFEIDRAALVPTALLKEDLNLDSLDFVDMVILLEERMGSAPTDIDFMKIRTLGDIYQLVETASARKAQPTVQ